MIKEMRFAEAEPDIATEAVFRKHIDASNAEHAINACTAKTNNCTAFTFRNMQQSIITADRGSGIEVFDVTADKRMKHPQQAKLFTWGGDVWAAIDTKAHKGNAIYLMNVSKQFSRPLELIFKGRNMVERNWSFFEHGGDLLAIHAVKPLRVLRLDRQTQNKAVFVEHASAEGRWISTLHIGSQACVHDDAAYFIAHRSIPLPSKRACSVMGSLVRVSLDDWTVSMSSELIAHSVAEAIQGRPARVGVRSLTYFGSSWIDANKTLRLGYGFNDKASAFSMHQLDSFNMLPIDSVITEAEVFFSQNSRPVNTQPSRKLSPEQIALATERASVCEKCEESRNIRLTIMTGIGEKDIYAVSCNKCTNCGGSMSLLTRCPEGKWEN